MYARAAIPEYWLVVVRKRSIEVLRDPDPQAGACKTRLTVTEPEAVTPIALPGPTVPVASLFD